MGKRKASAPQKTTDEKRVQLSWNMLEDLRPPGSLTVIGNSDPSLKIEADSAQKDFEVVSSSQRHKHGQNVVPTFLNDHLQEIFKFHLEDCLFYIKVQSELDLRKDEWYCLLGTFSVTFSDDTSLMKPPVEGLPPCSEYWIYVNDNASKCMLYCEGDENSLETSMTHANHKAEYYWVVKIDLPVSVLVGLQSIKLFQVTLQNKSMCIPDRNLRFNVYCREASISKLLFPSEPMKPKKQCKAIQAVIGGMYNIIVPSYEGLDYIKKHDIECLYQEVKRRHKISSHTKNTQHSNLIPILRPYQRDAVSWMLQNEIGSDNVKEHGLHCLYEEICTPDGQILYYHKYGGCLLRDKPRELPLPLGGILADEMGLGKTVEFLACMLAHDRPKEDTPPPQILPTLTDMENSQNDVLTGNVTVSAHKKMSHIDNITGNQHDRKPTNQQSKLSANSQSKPSANSQSKECEVLLIVSSQPVQPDAINSTYSDAVVSEKHSDVSPDPKVDEKVCRYASIVDHCYTDKTVEGVLKASESLEESKLENFENDSMEEVFHDSPKPKEIVSIANPEFTSFSDDQPDLALESNSLCDIFDAQNFSVLPDEPVCVRGDIQNQTELNESISNNDFSFADNLFSNSSPKNMEDSSNAIELVDDRHNDTENVLDESKCDKSVSNSFVTQDNTNTPVIIMDNIVTSENLQEISYSTHMEISECGTTSPIQKKNSENYTVTCSFVGENIELFSPDSMLMEPVHSNSDPCVTGTLDNQVTVLVCNSETDQNSNLNQNSQKPKYSIFDQPIVSQKQFFECVCGSKEMKKNKKAKRDNRQVQCVKCGVWQHAACLNYDLRDPYRGEYMCPHCHVQSEPVSSGATLIISPSTICYQWVEEIAKHVEKDTLKVFVYTGVNKMGFIQPRTLAKQDIVISTYETLRKELDYVDLPHINSEAGRRFRHPKRFMAKPSPIIAVEWWRICLDEAQMVEGTTTKTAEMALRLRAVNRWCVTGTPIQRSTEDLYGLLLFLGVDPYWVQQWWRQLLYDPFCYGIKSPLCDVLSTVLWRTAKQDVLDQIHIPDQTEQIHWLTFSPIEEHFYRRQYQDCGKEAMQKLSKWNDSSTKLSSLDKFTMSQLLHPLLRLRQACCHPQAVRGEFLPIHKSTMTMEELLESLTKKAKVECEEAHRQLVAAINGIAGLHIIRGQYVDAVDHYRQVLRSVCEHSEQLRTDDLQQLHAMHNLSEILSFKPEGIAPTLRDDMLQQQSDDLRKRYLTKASNFVSTSLDGLNLSRRTAIELKIALQDESEWWLDLIQWSLERYLDSDLVEKVREDICDNASPELNSITYRFRDARGLELVLHSQSVVLDSAYQKLQTALDTLNNKPSPDVVGNTVECCLRPIGNILKTCQFCKADTLFNEYESRLFSFVDRGIVVGFDEEDPQYQVHTRRQGTWADSELEKALKSILSFAKSFRADPETLEYGNIHMKLFDSMKKEFRNMRKLFMALKENVQTFDELDMATTRLRVRLPDEPLPEVLQPNILEPNQLDEHNRKLVSDKIITENQLRKKLGQLLYLKNLAKTQCGTEGGSNPDPCPICQRALGMEWSVLQCGHCFCLDCIRILVDQFSFGGRQRTVKCAICRQKTYHGEISYVSTGQKNMMEDGDLDITVKGSHSTKVEAVVRCLIAIKKMNPLAKALVFSTWVDVLNVIAVALEENGIGLKKLYAGGKFQDNLSAFKEEEEITALLLPILSGANGLNIIEATHVLLVEPILNPGQELQAIGRVHRIGQTHCTRIHRFLVRATIEQKMFNMLKNVTSITTFSSTDENILTIGDLVSLFYEESDGESQAEEDEHVMVDSSAHAHTPPDSENGYVFDNIHQPSTSTFNLPVSDPTIDCQSVVLCSSESVVNLSRTQEIDTLELVASSESIQSSVDTHTTRELNQRLDSDCESMVPPTSSCRQPVLNISEDTCTSVTCDIQSCHLSDAASDGPMSQVESMLQETSSHLIEHIDNDTFSSVTCNLQSCHLTRYDDKGIPLASHHSVSGDSSQPCDKASHHSSNGDSSQLCDIALPYRTTSNSTVDGAEADFSHIEKPLATTATTGNLTFEHAISDNVLPDRLSHRETRPGSTTDISSQNSQVHFFTGYNPSVTDDESSVTIETDIQSEVIISDDTRSAVR